MCRGVGSCLRLAVGFREIGKTFGVWHYCIQSGWKFANIGACTRQKASVVYIRTKTVELLESFTSGSLATKAPLSGQKTQVLISICDKCPWNEWRCDFSRANEAGLWRAGGCGHRKKVTNHLAPTIIFGKRCNNYDSQNLRIWYFSGHVGEFSKELIYFFFKQSESDFKSATL